mgnify:CR=1 FL=1
MVKAGSRAKPEITKADGRGAPWLYASHPVLNMLGPRVDDSVGDVVNDVRGYLVNLSIGRCRPASGRARPRRAARRGTPFALNSRKPG